MRIKYPLFLICIFAATASTTSAQAIQSIYTDLGEKKCKTLEQSTEGAGYSVQQCPGVAGYKLLAAEDDLRQSITVVKPNGSKHELNFWNLISPGFSSLGDKAEWRVKRQNGKVVPIALIVRFNASENPADSSKITSYLAVTKITRQQICLTDKIAPGPQANEEARRAADVSASKPCMK